MSLATVQRLRTRLNATMLALMAVAIGGAIYLAQQPQADDLLTRPPQDAVQNYSQFEYVFDLIGALPLYLVRFIGVAAIFAFFAGAYTYFLSGGNEEQINKGRMQMVGSMIALFIVIFAENIVNIFVNFFAGK